MAVQIAADGRRILWLAHENAPKNFTALDVSDPRAPRLVIQTDLPEPFMRSNSLEVVGNIMAVAYQTRQAGQKPAGMELFDVSLPEEPRSIGFFDASGPHSRGVHQLWFCDGEYVHMSAGAEDFQSHRPRRRPVLPHRRRAQPFEAGRSRPLVAAGRSCRRQRGPAGSAQSRAAPASASTTPTSIRSGRTAPISAASMAASSSSISPTRAGRRSSPAGTIHRPISASPTRCCRSSAAACWWSPTN